MIVDLGVIDWAAIGINRCPSPKKQRRPPLNMKPMRNGCVRRHRNKLFACAIGSYSSRFFEEPVERLAKIFATG